LTTAVSNGCSVVDGTMVTAPLAPAAADDLDDILF
jgi:hypothetical protein